MHAGTVSHRCSFAAKTQRLPRYCSASVGRRRFCCTALASVGAGQPRVIRGRVFVTRDNIDTDQIIPAEYLTLVPSKAEEYEKLGSYALIGLPDDLYPERFVEPGQMKTSYPIVIGGNNFGCGSSREHAPVAMGAAGGKVVVAQSYARIFFRNCVSTLSSEACVITAIPCLCYTSPFPGELYPCETDERLCDILQTGQEVEVDMEKDVLTVVETGQKFSLKPLGEAGPVIDAGGIFEFARRAGMIQTA